jgi:glycosyltransferase involved in cell wall biosynthesis
MRPEVSVVVPTHDRPDLLAATLSTILWQRDVDLEVIVVDDGSHDANVATSVVNHYHDRRIRVVRHESSRGVSAARNRGIADSHGSWLAFCDDDDLWAPDKLVRQLAAARENARRWVYSGAVRIDLSQHIIGGTPPPNPDDFLAYLPRWNPMPGGCSGVLASASVVAQVGSFDARFRHFADWDLWIRLARAGPPAVVSDPLVAYRIHPGNKTLDTAGMLEDVALIEQAYGTKPDWGAIHHYLAWVYLRSGRRAAALRHFAQAALLHGSLVPVARSFAVLARRRLPSRLAGPGPDVAGSRLWREPAGEWLDCVDH